MASKSSGGGGRTARKVKTPGMKDYGNVAGRGVPKQGGKPKKK